MPAANLPVAAISLFAHGGGGHRPRHLVRYEYTDATGRQHEGEGRASFKEWNHATPGSPIAVRYVRSDPQQSQLASAIWDLWPALPFGLLGLVIVAGSLWRGSRGMRWANKQVRLVLSGQPVRGRILRAEAERRGKRGREVVTVLEYEYDAARPIAVRLELAGKPRPDWRSGGDILILVDPYDPTQHAPDLFDARSWDREIQLGSRSVG
jgi:hypothetical protein